MSVVSVVKCKDYHYGHVEQAVEESVKNIGGLDDIIKSGDRVLLKINLTDIQEPDKAVTTHPAIKGGGQENNRSGSACAAW
jgi:uncharacterized protein (DUF362 family)